MDLSKEQIKKILDEAPEGATDWCTCNIGNFSGQYGFSGCCLHGGKFTNAVWWNQIPLSDLRKQMGGPEWDGEGLPPIGVECEVYGGFGKYDEWKKCEVFAIKHYDVFMSDGERWWVTSKDAIKFRTLETEAEKAGRERLEAAYDLYLAFWSASKSSIMLESYSEFSSQGNSDLKHFLAIVDKTNYRKGE